MYNLLLVRALMTRLLTFASTHQKFLEQNPMTFHILCKQNTYFFFSSPVLTNWEQGAGFDVFGQDSKEKPPSRIPVKRGAGNTQEMPERRPAWLYLKQGKRKQKLLVPTQIK